MLVHQLFLRARHECRVRRAIAVARGRRYAIFEPTMQVALVVVHGDVGKR